MIICDDKSGKKRSNLMTCFSKISHLPHKIGYIWKIEFVFYL